MPGAKLETADELFALFNDPEKLKGLRYIFLVIYFSS
jgi:hypothetical protein